MGQTIQQRQAKVWAEIEKHPPQKRIKLELTEGQWDEVTLALYNLSDMLKVSDRSAKEVKDRRAFIRRLITDLWEAKYGEN